MLNRFTTIVARIASLLVSIENCRLSLNKEWEHRHEESLMDLTKNHLPSGSGIDNGTKLDREKSTPDKLIFIAGFHHMNADGFYVGWTYHRIIVTPAFEGINVRVTGRNKNQIKDYLAEVYDAAMREALVD